MDMWSGWREKDYQSQTFTWKRGGKEKQREAEEDLDGQCQGRPEGEKHRLDQEWRGNQKPSVPEESGKNLNVSMLMEERREEVFVTPAPREASSVD